MIRILPGLLLVIFSTAVIAGLPRPKLIHSSLQVVGVDSDQSMATFLNSNQASLVLSSFALAHVAIAEDKDWAEYLGSAAKVMDSEDLPYLVVLTGDGRPFYALSASKHTAAEILTLLSQVVQMAKDSPREIEVAAREVFLAIGGKTFQDKIFAAHTNPLFSEWGSNLFAAHPVEAQARLKGGGNQFELLLNLDIASGYHINSATPYQDFLIASHVDAASGIKIDQAKWPAGKDLNVEFFDEPISVYEGQLSVLLTGTFGPGTKPVFTLHFQACSESECLPPQELPLRFDE